MSYVVLTRSDDKRTNSPRWLKHTICVRRIDKLDKATEKLEIGAKWFGARRRLLLAR